MMHIQRLDLLNFRNYAELSITPDPGLNILLGKNAQGKTSVLEAVYFLAVARSWRAGRDSELIRWGTDASRIFSDVSRENRNDIEVEVILNRSEKKQITVNTIRQTRLSDLMGQVNVLLIEPHDGEIVRGDPGTRRKFLNLEISQVQPQYCHLFANYRKVLEQRNRLLRDMQGQNSNSGVLEVLNQQFISYASQILQRRLAYIRQISPLARTIHSRITDNSEELDVSYSSRVDLDGVSEAGEIAGCLAARLSEVKADEIRRGLTLLGPQRDDLRFTINKVDARIYGSQGQQRTISLSLRLAELELMQRSAKEPPIVLLDDVMTDLDEERRAHVFELTQGRCQTFLTAASRRVLDEEFLSGGRLYSVSEGRVSQE